MCKSTTNNILVLVLLVYIITIWYLAIVLQNMSARLIAIELILEEPIEIEIN